MLDYQPTNEDGYAVRPSAADAETISTASFRWWKKISSPWQSRWKRSRVSPGWTRWLSSATFNSVCLVNKITHVAVVAEPAWMRVSTDLFGSLFPGRCF